MKCTHLGVAILARDREMGQELSRYEVWDSMLFDR